MPISERTLRRWRRDALMNRYKFSVVKDGVVPGLDYKSIKEMNDRVIRMTQEILDFYLTRGAKA